MAKIENREDLIAGRYDGIPVGPSMLYSFETQAGLPVDNTNPMLRELSPFTIRMVPPTIIDSGIDPNVNINLIGRASSSMDDQEAAAKAVRSLFGTSSVTGNTAQDRLNSLQQIVAAGQIISGVTSTTERAVLTDLTTAADIAYQVERILQTSPLTLLVNPNDMSTSYTAIQNFSERSRKGFIFQRWGEGQPSVSFSGSTGAFVAAVAPGSGFPGTTETASPSGLQYASKRDSAAWQNFMALYLFYKNNGYIYDTIGKSEAHLMIGALAIDYDQFTYVGHIESFEWSEQQDSPHRVEWSMEFIVDLMYDTAQAPVTVQPMASPTPSPSWPARGSQSFITRPDATSGGAVFDVSGTEQFAEAPLELLLPSQLKSR